MMTTALIIEHLITGLMTVLAMLMGFLAWLGPGAVSPGELSRIIKEYKELVAGAALVLGYPVGVMVDAFADDFVFARWSDAMREAEKVGPLRVMGLLQAKDGGFLQEYFDYGRRRVRLMRSATINFGLLAMTGPAFARSFMAPGLARERTFWAAMAVMAVLALLSVWSWNQVMKTQLRRLKMAAEFTRGDADPLGRPVLHHPAGERDRD